MSDRTRIDRIVEGALACPAGDRDAFLDAACEGNAALRQELASLLAQASRAHSFMEEPAAAPSLVGRTLGPYRIDASIGAGGMGEVYRARDTKLGRDVAIKIQLMAVKVSPGVTAAFGVPERLFTLYTDRAYGVNPDGSKFLVLVPKTSPSSSLKLTLNWFASR